MARFDVHELKDGSGLVVVCQADLLDVLSTRFVAPLMPLDQAPRPATRLNPIFDFHGKTHVLVTQFAASVESRELGTIVGTLAAFDTKIIDAFDMLLTGY